MHAAGGRIFLQLWHMGRTSHPDFLGGALPVGPSAIAAKGETHTPQGKKSYVTPRALRTDELAGIVAEYAAGAKRARAAGFDGVEIHGANGYLIDQFLRTGSNQRTDAYGGAVENRARLLLEVTKAVVAAWSADRVGVRLSPRGAYNDMVDADPAATFTFAAEQLGRLGIAYLHAMEPLPGHMMAAPGERLSPAMKKAFGGVFIANGGYDAASGGKRLEAKEADLIAFGVPFLSNPDLVERYRARRGPQRSRLRDALHARREGLQRLPRARGPLNARPPSGERDLEGGDVVVVAAAGGQALGPRDARLERGAAPSAGAPIVRLELLVAVGGTVALADLVDPVAVEQHPRRGRDRHGRRLVREPLDHPGHRAGATRAPSATGEAGAKSSAGGCPPPAQRSSRVDGR